jgi:oxygen-independent coproporphyrinogen-3 oxidase
VTPPGGNAALGGPGLYLHVPYCSAICPYCDFSVLTGPPEERRAYATLMLAEAALVGSPAEPFDTVYLGGGTPSSLPGEALAEVLDGLRRVGWLAPGVEITLEANPEDVSRDSVAGWRELGVDTLSLGVQSFDAASLRFLGRRHGPAEGRAAVETALAGGFSTVSLDLIYGLPGQDATGWRRELEKAVAVAPHHLSCYQLTVHGKTPFGFRRDRGRLVELPEEAQGRLFRLAHRFLDGAGYTAYEVSNFAAAPEHRSRHNRKYWRHVPYLGLGPSAHSFDGRRRWWNWRKIKPWRSRVSAGERPVEGEEILGAEELALEALMLGLRTVEGVDLDTIRERWGIDLLAANGARIYEWVRGGLCRLDESRLIPTLDGLSVADGLAAGLSLEPTPAQSR